MRKFLVLTILLTSVFGFSVTVNRYVAQVLHGKYQCLQFNLFDDTSLTYYLADVEHQQVISLLNGWPHHIIPARGVITPLYSSDRRYVAQRRNELDGDNYVQRLRVEDTQSHERWIVGPDNIILWRWSPDTDRLVYVWREEFGTAANYYISSANPDGTGIISSPFPGRSDVPLPIIGAFYGIRFSSDGAYMALKLNDDKDKGYLGLFDAHTLKIIDLRVEPPFFSWSPQGHRFAYWQISDKGEQNVVIETPDNGIEMRFSYPYHNDAVETFDFTWSPDGRYIASASLRHNYRINDDQLYYDFFDTQSYEQWLDIPGTLRGANFSGYIGPDDGRWSPDSRTWVFWQQRSGSVQSVIDLVQADITNKTLKTLATNAMGPGRNTRPSAVYSPDDYRIALSVWHGNKVDVILTNSDGTNFVTLPTEADWVDNLTWSPDGRFVVGRAPVQTTISPGQARLFWARADGTDFHTLSDKYISNFGWNPETNELVFFSRSESTAGLMQLNLETNTSRMLFDDPQRELFSSEQSAISGYLKFYPSPDGKRVVIAYSAGVTVGENIFGRLFLVSWDGKEKRKLRDNLRGIEAFWSPDASAFVLRNSEGIIPRYLEVFARDGSVLWSPAAMKSLDIDPESAVWTGCH